MASTDGLTGLANRERLQARVEQDIGAAGRAGEGFGVMLIDLDRFKEINDTLGHHDGDGLLRERGPRLAACAGRCVHPRRRRRSPAGHDRGGARRGLPRGRAARRRQGGDPGCGPG
jgi:predicted signal transduction protein with EAL and GGDEF domain